MNDCYLLDEHLPKWWRRAIVAKAPELTVWSVGDPDAPSRETLDPEILEWCENHGFVLLTNNRKSLKRHLAEHVAKDHHVPGIFVVNPNSNVVALAVELALIAGASFEEEYQDQIRYLPLT